MQTFFVYYFAVYLQTSVLIWQIFNLFYLKLSAKFNELRLNFPKQ